MKYKYFSSALVLCALFTGLLLAGCSASKKWVKLEPSDVSAMVNSGSFIFVAEKMNPLRGPQKTLSAYYDVRVNNDTLNSFLPYYGRAYGGIIDPTKGGLRFDSQDYTYTVAEGRKNSWDVTIRPEDVSQVQSLNFTVFDNGTATLNVTSTNKDAISFYGQLQPVERP